MERQRSCTATKEELLQSDNTLNVFSKCPLCEELGSTFRVGQHASTSISQIKHEDSSSTSANLVYPHEHERKMSNRLLSANGDESEEVEEQIERNKVVVRVPATTANLGPGFDTIGMALDMWSEITVERSEVFEIVCEGEGSHDMPLDETNLVCLGMSAAFKAAGKDVPILKYKLVNRIPYAR